ncbi:MAG: DUF2384 domain-containing protein [Acidiferrobacterales bacterium]|nr:DUF2384 domain-containing protein [Acidiferrobacterales bacterium]
MTNQTKSQFENIQSDVVLAKAVLKASKQLGLKQQDLARVLGVHRTSIGRLNQNPRLDPTSKQGELALILIRVAQALFALTGGDEVWMRRFMHSPNSMTNGIPAKQIETVQGLTAVLRYVDAIREKI